MKTITEFSGTVLREAARIRKLHRPVRPAQRPEAAEKAPDEAEDRTPPDAEARLAGEAPGTEAALTAPADAQAPVEISEAAAGDEPAGAENAEELEGEAQAAAAGEG